MKFLLVFAVAAAYINGVTAYAVDLGAPLQGSSRKLQEPEPGNKTAEDGAALETKDHGLHSNAERIENTANKETVKTNSQLYLGDFRSGNYYLELSTIEALRAVNQAWWQPLQETTLTQISVLGFSTSGVFTLLSLKISTGLLEKSKPGETRSDKELKEAKKTVFKRNAEERNAATTTPARVAGSNSATHAPAVFVQKPKPRETRTDKELKEAEKVVFKRNAEESNTTTSTPARVAGSTSATHAPAVFVQFPSTTPPTQQTYLLAGYGNNGFQPGLMPPVQVAYAAPSQTESKNQKTEDEKKPDYTNIVAILSGGGLVSVAKAIQTFFNSRKEKKEKEKKKNKKGKKGKRRRRDSESSNSDSDSEDEQDEPKPSVAVQIEMKTQTSIEPTPAQKKVDSEPAKKKIDSPPVEKKTVPAITI